MNRPATMRQLHAALAHRGLMDDKKAIIAQFTNDRTESASELTDRELTELVHQMNATPTIICTTKKKPTHEDRQRERMIRSLYGHARQLGWFAPDSKGGVKVDAVRLNSWCEKHTPAHLPFKKMNVEELAAAVTCIKNYVKTDTNRLAR